MEGKYCHAEWGVYCYAEWRGVYCHAEWGVYCHAEWRGCTVTQNGEGKGSWDTNSQFPTPFKKGWKQNNKMTSTLQNNIYNKYTHIRTRHFSMISFQKKYRKEIVEICPFMYLHKDSAKKLSQFKKKLSCDDVWRKLYVLQSQWKIETMLSFLFQNGNDIHMYSYEQTTTSFTFVNLFNLRRAHDLNRVPTIQLYFILFSFYILPSRICSVIINMDDVIWNYHNFKRTLL